MTQEDKLLLKDLCARLPYGVKAQVCGWDEEKGEVEVPLKVYSINTDGYLSFEYNHYSVETVYVEDCRLYLRPMSSMTEEERNDFSLSVSPKGSAIYYNDFIGIPLTHLAQEIPYEYIARVIDWLNAHHFDYRGLIPKGLAISTEEFNPYKD